MGYNIKISDKFLLDIFAGGGWHQGFYHGYYNDGTPGKYEKLNIGIKVANGFHIEVV